MTNEIASCLAMTKRFAMTNEIASCLAMTVHNEKQMKPGYIYILTNKNNTTLYVGVTANLIARIEQHQQKVNPKSFTARYNLNKLVYYEAFQMIGDAIAREKQIKAGSRAKKIALIEKNNANWADITTKMIQETIR